MSTVIRPSRRLFATANDCTTPDKVRYHTEQAAQRFAVQNQQRYYQCQCGSWHLTSQGVTSAYIEDLRVQIAEREETQQWQQALKDRVQRIESEREQRRQTHEQRVQQYEEFRAQAKIPRIILQQGERVYLEGMGYGRITGFYKQKLRKPIIHWDDPAANERATNGGIININTKPLARWPF